MKTQKNVLTITLNPAVDIATSVPKVVAGPKLYCRSARVDPGGGGVNVARAIQRLGGTACAFVVVAGSAGRRLCEMLTEEDVRTSPFEIDGETRQSFAVTDESTGEQFRFSLPGDALSSDTAIRLLSEISATAPDYAFVVLSGGIAPGLGDDFPERVHRAVTTEGTRLIVDTSKAPLSRLVTQPVSPLFLLRVDQFEAEQLAGIGLSNIEDHIGFAENLIEHGVAQNVISGRGAEGSLLVTRTRRLLCQPPKLDVISKIGAGDAFVGAFTLSLARGEGLEEALRWGVAAAGATMSSPGTGLFRQADAEALFDHCLLKPC